MKKYLTAGESGRGYGLYRMVAESSGTDKGVIASAIRRMPYQEFLSTRYWKIVTQQVKNDAGWRCSECGLRSNLSVHHPDYTRHGYEMYHIDELECLCRMCHDKRHKL